MSRVSKQNKMNLDVSCIKGYSVCMSKSVRHLYSVVDEVCRLCRNQCMTVFSLFY